jgi:hypothetical protein
MEVAADRQWWPSLSGAGFSFEYRPTEAVLADAPTRFRPPEIHILSRSFERANAAALLLYAAHALIDAGIPMRWFAGWSPYHAIPTNNRELARIAELFPDDSAPQPIRLQAAGTVDVAGLAARLSRRNALSQAAYFHLASAYLVTINSTDLHPGENEARYFQTPYLLHRVWEAQSLFAAFQAIDALNLTVKGATADRPSVVAKKWDANIRADLEARLLEIGIEPTKTVSWSVRGRRRGLLPKLQERTSESRPSAWASGDNRDEDIPVVDAINRAHWLRSNVSAHRTENLPKVSLLDAVNVQHLARLLIMSAARFPWWHTRGKGT